MVTNGYKMVTNQSQPCMQTHLLPARTLLLPCHLVTGHQPITGQLIGGLLCIVYIRSGSLYHMSVAIKMVKGKPVLISYKDELMLVREKMEAMKLWKKVLDLRLVPMPEFRRTMLQKLRPKLRPKLPGRLILTLMSSLMPNLRPKLVVGVKVEFLKCLKIFVSYLKCL